MQKNVLQFVQDATMMRAQIDPTSLSRVGDFPSGEIIANGRKARAANVGSIPMGGAGTVSRPRRDGWREMANDTKAQEEAVDRLFQRARRIFAGKPPDITGAVLAELVALWIASHVTDEKAWTNEVRDRLLQVHVDIVRDLIPVMFEHAIKPKLAERKPAQTN